MALITDPDNLSQGASTTVTDCQFHTKSGSQITLSSTGGNLPSCAAGDYFEIRDHTDPTNNGLYIEVGGSPTASQIVADKQSGSNPVSAAAESLRFLHSGSAAADEKSVFFDTAARNIYLFEQGNLSTDGATLQAIYSFAKEEWKDDADLIAFDFPFVAVTPEQFEWVDDWVPQTASTAPTTTEKLIRTGGWSEVDGDGNTIKQYFGVITLGSFEDTGTDNAYYQFGTDQTTDDTINFTFNGPVNEAVLSFEELGNPATCTFATTSTITRASGSFVTDGYKVGGAVTIRNATSAGNDGTFNLTAVAALTLTGSGAVWSGSGADTNAILAVDNRSAFSPKLRVRDGDPEGKTYDSSDLTAIGVTTLTNKVERFPLANATDLKIGETDANISSANPYTEITARYLDATYNAEVDTTTKRDFGIIIDVGTYSESNGESVASTTFQSVNIGDITLADFASGTLILREGSDQGTHNISGTPTSSGGTLIVELSSALTTSATNLSFTLQRAAAVTATAEEIYEKIQYLLRQTTDIDGTDGTVIGRAADELLTFVGDTLNAGVDTPTNPNGGGSGVYIAGFDSNDTNRLGFTDNGGTLRNFPFVAAGTINFNPNLVSDSAGKYWMYFTYTTQTAVADLRVSNASADTATLASVGSNLPALTQDDYIYVSGATNATNNGIWIVTDASPTGLEFDARKVNGEAVVDETAYSAVVNENPINSPDAIIVDNNAGTDITGAIGAASVNFDFDYDGNVQGGRTAATDAAITLRAIGLETGQFVETTGTITRNTGLSFSLVAGLERNYSNP